jgi:hypothetical protein
MIKQDEEKQKQKHNAICDGHHYLQTNTNYEWRVFRNFNRYYFIQINNIILRLKLYMFIPIFSKD